MGGMLKHFQIVPFTGGEIDSISTNQFQHCEIYVVCNLLVYLH